MPDQEARIAQWRENLARALGNEPHILDELEGHLRDQIEALVRQGQSAEAATDVALARLGAPETVAAEFAKNSRPWRPLYVWAAVVVAALAAVMVQVVSLTDRLAGQPILLVHALCISIGYVLGYGVGGLALVYAVRRMVRDLPLRQRAFWLKTLRWTAALALTFTIVGFACALIWAAERLGAAWTWDPRDIGGVLVLAWLLATLALAWRTAPPLTWLLCVGLLGNLVVTGAWFVAQYFARLHSYPTGWTPLATAACWILAITHLLLMAGTLAPSGWLRRGKASA